MDSVDPGGGGGGGGGKHTSSRPSAATEIIENCLPVSLTSHSSPKS